MIDFPSVTGSLARDASKTRAVLSRDCLPGREACKSQDVLLVLDFPSVTGSLARDDRKARSILSRD